VLNSYVQTGMRIGYVFIQHHNIFTSFHHYRTNSIHRDSSDIRMILIIHLISNCYPWPFLFFVNLPAFYDRFSIFLNDIHVF